MGDFLILNKKYGNYPVYYLSKDQILEGDGMKGKICLEEKEILKLIKCLNNLLYVVIQKKIYVRIYKINN